MDPTSTSTLLADLLRSSGWLVFLLPAEVTTRDSFFDAVRAVFPLAPPLVSNGSWDALSDSLFEGLSHLSERQIAIIWPRAAAQTEDMTTALGILDDVRHALATENDKSVLVVLAPAHN
jgi:hypothetical protein